MSSARASVDGLGAVAGLGDDLEVGRCVEHEAQAVADDRVVVGEQDPGLERDGHRPSPSTGTSSRTSVPGLDASGSPGCPPTSSARSRIPAMPAVVDVRWRGIP